MILNDASINKKYDRSNIYIDQIWTKKKLEHREDTFIDNIWIGERKLKGENNSSVILIYMLIYMYRFLVYLCGNIPIACIELV